jgi:hypothetical protein
MATVPATMAPNSPRLRLHRNRISDGDSYIDVLGDRSLVEEAFVLKGLADGLDARACFG